MSKSVVCAVFDSAVQAYGRPIFGPSIGAVVRSFVDEVNRSADDNPFNKHPDDYALYLLAEFEDQDGVFTVPAEGVRCLSRAKDVKGN